MQIYYTIYKTTNLLNNKFYIGKHVTTDPNDHYLGSGNIILRAIKKYDKHNFSKEIILFCKNEKEMNEKEKDIVNESVVNNLDCYNLKIGGHGGWTIWNKTDAAKAAREKGLAKARKAVPEINRNRWKNMTEIQKIKALNILRSYNHAGKKRSIETREKMSKSKKINNSSFNTHFYIDGSYTGSSKSAYEEFRFKRFKCGTEPDGWILSSIWKENNKNKNNNAYGKHWYNDGINNYLYYESEQKILLSNLKRGRIQKQKI